MMDCEWGAQVIHLQPLTNGTACRRRVSVSVPTLPLITTSQFARFISSHRCASPDATTTLSLKHFPCRAVQPARYLERKGPRPFNSNSTSLLAPATSILSQYPRAHSPSFITQPKNQEPERLDPSHLGERHQFGEHQEDRLRGVIAAHYEEKVMRHWSSHKFYGLATSPTLESVDHNRSETSLQLPLDRMSLALFNFGTLHGPSRIVGSQQLEAPWQRIDQQHSISIASDPLSTPSISLDEANITENEEISPSHKLKERDLLGLLKVPVAQIHGHEIDEGSTSDPCTSKSHPCTSTSDPCTSFDSRAQELRQTQGYRSRLWDRKPKGLYFDSESLSSFSPFNAYDISHIESYTWHHQENTRLRPSITRSRPVFPSSRLGNVVPINTFQEYPFPRMDFVEIFQS